MAGTLMPWFRVDDRLHAHPKWMDCSLAARGLWISAGSWCASCSHDGIVTRMALRHLGASPRHARELVDAGLWEPHDKGWLFHDWAHYQPTSEQVAAERMAARERQQRARERSAKARNDRGPDLASRRDNAVTHADVTPAVTVASRSPRPDPSRPLDGTGTRGSPPLAPANPATLDSEGVVERARIGPLDPSRWGPEDAPEVPAPRCPVHVDGVLSRPCTCIDLEHHPKPRLDPAVASDLVSNVRQLRNGLHPPEDAA